MLIVRGAVKDYDWGIVDGLQDWSAPTGGPQAELWYGVHPGGPSPLIDTAGVPTGEHLADHFDIEAIPLLVKLLAAARPLSVQVHPSREIAEAGWAAQADPALPRVLSDPFEKTELLVALDEFEAFCGWRPLDQAAAVLAGVPGCEAALEAVRAGDRASAVRALRDASTPDAIAALPDAVRAAGLPTLDVDAYATVVDHYAQDPGALVTVLLACVELSAGQAAYVPAGLPHSYIRGIGLEVMTSSDNVIRLGLTGKPVFVDQAIAALDLDAEPQVLRTHHGDLIWPVDAPFVVRVLRSGRERIPEGAYRIVLLIDGSARVESELGEVSLRRGTAAVISATEPDSFVEADGLVAVIQATQR